MTHPSPSGKSFGRPEAMTEKTLARIAVVATFVLLLLGGLVHATGSSLACPDWPLCFGQVFPKMEGGVLVEHSHRLFASAVGIVSVLLAIRVSRRPSAPRRLRRLVLLAVGLVVFQGVLGGVTVLLKLPLLVSTAHLATSMLFFGVLLRIVFESEWEARPTPPRAGPIASLQAWTFIGLLCVYAQIVLGAFVRHAGAGLACNTTILTCNGALWPTGLDSGPAKLHMLHRLAAIVVAVVVVAVAAVVRRRATEAGRTKLAGWAAAGPVLLAVQIALGVATVKSYVNIPIVVAHLGVAAILLAQQIGLYLACRREAEAHDPWQATAVSSRLPLAPEPEPQP